MAMNKAALEAALKSRIDSELTSELAPYINPPDDHQAAGFSLADYLDRFATAVAKAVTQEVIDHITGNAQCFGLDSRGDSHEGVGII